MPNMTVFALISGFSYHHIDFSYGTGQDTHTIFRDSDRVRQYFSRYRSQTHFLYSIVGRLHYCRTL